MAQSMRVSLPGYNALTDTDPDHYALYADEDWVLIKEKTRGTGTLDYTASDTIAHGLGYIPMVFLWGEDSDGNLILQGLTNALEASNEWLVEIDDTNITVSQLVGVDDRDYKYYIFYDKLE